MEGLGVNFAAPVSLLVELSGAAAPPAWPVSVLGPRFIFSFGALEAGVVQA